MDEAYEAWARSAVDEDTNFLLITVLLCRVCVGDVKRFKKAAELLKRAFEAGAVYAKEMK